MAARNIAIVRVTQRLIASADTPLSFSLSFVRRLFA
jgi:hypothetical protein